jgi:hypothetical protein
MRGREKPFIIISSREFRNRDFAHPPRWNAAPAVKLSALAGIR